MPYGSTLVDSITSSNNFNIIGNVTGATNITTTGNITTSPGILYPLMASTPVNTTSGSPITLATDLPTWVKRITVVLNGCSLTTAVAPQIQLGYGTTPTWQTTGYDSSSDNYSLTSGPTSSSTVGFVVGSAYNIAASWNCNYVLCNITGTNIWVGSLTGADRTAGVLIGGGIVTLTDKLTAVRLSSSSGTYDAGSAFILYE